MHPVVLAVLTFCSASLVNGIPVDNGVEGEPEIECGGTSITVNFNTRNPFEGHVFVKNLYSNPECRNDEGGNRVTGISLPFDTCNVRRTRSLEPRGVFVTVTVIISFHPQFITKVDRAYTLQCFYMEADKTVSTELEVSMLTTGFQTQTVPMPICRYEILDGSPSGPPIQYALIGQKVYHKWICESETSDTFCMVVHDCFVDDGNNDRVDLLDQNGCSLDRYLLRNLEYGPGQLMAGQETHVFKYADRAQLFFQCQITITIKEPNLQCPIPECGPEPLPSETIRNPGPDVIDNGYQAPPVRGRRNVNSAAGTMDVFAQLESLVMEPGVTLDEIRPTQLGHHEYCISTAAFIVMVTFTLIASVCVMVAIGMLCTRNGRKTQV